MRHDSIENDTDPSGPRRRGSRRSIALIAGAAIAVAGLLVSSVAASSSPTPKHGDDIPNVTQVENQIKAYYGDTVVGTDHFPSPTGNYAHEVEGIEAQAQQYLAHHSTHGQGAPALVFDVDDTTLNTYNYEIFSSFAFNPTTNADFVNTERFPAVFGMPDLVNWAGSHGYTVFFLTGRPEAQREHTAGNLVKVGYTVPTDADHLYLKFPAGSPPAYLHCAAVTTCTTIEYKSGTRGHIESLGYHIIADFGDQFSDLEGGFTDQTFKLPNPMYFLP
jgi:hypothetical protein